MCGVQSKIFGGGTDFNIIQSTCYTELRWIKMKFFQQVLLWSLAIPNLLETHSAVLREKNINNLLCMYSGNTLY